MHLGYLESNKSEYLWSVYPSIPLFDVNIYFTFCLIIISIIIDIILNADLLFLRSSLKENIFLDAYQA